MIDQNARAVQLRGFLVEENDRELRVKVAGGTWLLGRDDILSLDDWDNPVSVDFDGRPVAITTKPGATIGFLQRVRVDEVERPMTLSDEGSKLFGNQELERMTQEWGGRMGFDMAAEAVGASPSACCWEDPSGWGMICKADDCQD